MCYFLQFIYAGTHASISPPAMLTTSSHCAWHSSSSSISVSIITFCFFLFVCIYFIILFVAFFSSRSLHRPSCPYTSRRCSAVVVEDWPAESLNFPVAAASCLFHWYCLQHRLRSKGWFFIFRPAWAGDAASRVPLSSPRSACRLRQSALWGRCRVSARRVVLSMKEVSAMD